MSAHLHGVAVSPGSAIGPVVLVGSAPAIPVDEPRTTDVAATQQRVAEAFDSVAESLERRAESATDTAREILQMTALMARDKTLRKAVDERIAAGSGPLTAVSAGVGQICDSFLALGDYFAERVTDVRDVGNRVVARLSGTADPGIPLLESQCVLVADDLAPAETATLDPALVLGIITEAGGRNGHTAILAAQLGIPAVVQVVGATDLTEGTIVAVDGDTGQVTVDPDGDLRDALQHKVTARNNAIGRHHGAGRTKDGHPVALLANIGTAKDAEAAATQDVEGVGLFRTEVLFLGQQSAPGVEEQTAIYRRVFAAFGSRRVVVRTLDAGADKPLSFADLGAEDNPALGVRGLRMSQARPDLLDDQLAALAAAAKDTDAAVKVMAPMVATVDEARWFAQRVHDNGLPESGVMIEVPAAALRAETVLAEVEFGSLGTNDLAQYTMAADRTHSAFSDLLDPWQPAVLDVIAAASTGASSARRPLGVCGESAGDPLMACVLTGLGVTSLSMAPAKLGLVRFALATHSLDTCTQMAHAARSATSPAEALAAAAALAEPGLRDLL